MTRASLLARLRPVAPTILLIVGVLLLCCSALLLGIYLDGALLGAVFATAATGGAAIVFEWLLRGDSP